jgi:hypothetical protein
MFRTLVLSLAVVAPPLVAQQAPLAGTWKVSYPAGSKMENGTVTNLTGTGTLTVTTQADSLIATLVLDPSAELPSRPPLRLAGVTSVGEVTFQGKSAGAVNINGESRPLTVYTTWRVRAQGDSLSGTVERKIEGGPPMSMVPVPQPMMGSRVKS